MNTRSLLRRGSRALAVLLACGVTAPLRPAQGAGGVPTHTVKGNGVFFLDTGAPNGGNLVLTYAINASLGADGTARGSITSAINAITLPSVGRPDPYGTGDPVRYQVISMSVSGNEALIEAKVVFAPDFPDEVGHVSTFDIVDNGATPDVGDEITIDGDGPLVSVAGHIAVR